MSSYSPLMCSAHAFKERFCISEILGLACNEVVVMATTFKSKYFHSQHKRGKHENRDREMSSTEGIRCTERTSLCVGGGGKRAPATTPAWLCRPALERGPCEA